MSTSWHAILTPSDRAGAIAMIQLCCESPAVLGLPDVLPNQVRRADLLGIDDGVILGLDDQHCVLMPHGGIAIVRKIADELTSRGLPARSSVDPMVLYPEASCEIEAWGLCAMSLAPSPMAVDTILDHVSRRISSGTESVSAADTLESGQNRTLDRLIHPPTVVAVGRANIGKSSLLNALVGQQVAMVADVSGTTRDHVGAPVNLAGLVVRWIDTPGIDERIEDPDEIEIATRVVANADLVVHCIDAMGDPGVMDPRLQEVIPGDTPIIRVGSRADLGDHACDTDLRVQVAGRHRGVTDLVSMIREALVPKEVLSESPPWRFWDSIRP